VMFKVYIYIGRGIFGILTARSMVLDGDVTTMKGHTVLSHALSTKEKQWMLNLDVNRENDCVSW